MKLGIVHADLDIAQHVENNAPLNSVARAIQIYASADLLGICRAEPPRPVLPLPETARQRVAEQLKIMELR